MSGLTAATGVVVGPAHDRLFVKSGTLGRMWSIPITGDGSLGTATVVTDQMGSAVDLSADLTYVYGVDLDTPTLRRFHPDDKTVDQTSIAGHYSGDVPGGGVTVEPPGLPSSRAYYVTTGAISPRLFSLRLADVVPNVFSGGDEIGIPCGAPQYLVDRPSLHDLVGPLGTSLVSISVEDATCSTVASGFVKPAGVAWDDLHGTLYVADTTAGTLTSVDALGAHPLASALNKPHGVAFDGFTGALFVAETGANRVCGLKVSVPAPPPAPTVAGLVRPSGLVLKSGTLFVKSGTLGRMWAIPVAADGTLGQATVATDEMGSAVDLTADATYVYGIDLQTLTLRRFRPDNGITEQTTVFGKFAGDEGAGGLAVVGTQLFYVTEGGLGPRLFALPLIDFQPDMLSGGNEIGIPCGAPQYLISRPSVHDLAATVDTSAVSLSLASGTCSPSVIASGLPHPGGVAWDDAHQNLYISDSALEKVFKVDGGGMLSMVVAPRLSLATGMAFHAPSGRLFVAATGADGVSVVSPQ